MRPILPVLWGSLLLATLIPAQSPSPLLPPAASQTSAPPLPELHAHATVVLVPTLVRSSDGKPVYTLSASDFTLTDDNQPQILHLDEESSAQPLALVLVLQTGGLGAQHIDDLDRVSSMLDSVVGNVPHRVALISFDSTPHLLLGFTPKTSSISNAIEALPTGDEGAALLDALSLAVNELRKEPPAWRRVILMVSETLDHGSHIRQDDALRSITETNTAIYSFAFSSTRARAAKESGEIVHNDKPGPANGCMGHDPGTEPTHGKKRAEQAWDCLNLLAPPLRLAQMALIAGVNALQQNTAETAAQVSGGEYFRFKNAATLTSDLVTLSNHLPNRYLLSFQPQNPHAGLHHLEVKLQDYPHLTVLARTSYWADPSETQK